MTYEESRAYIKDAEKYGSIPGLDTIKALLHYLDNPERSLSVIHVAGTNGKGSVTAFLYTVLIKAGYHAGRYTSPAVFHYRERFETDGRVISREEFAHCMNAVAGAVSRMTADGHPHPTSFELETAAALVFFAEKKCDIVIIEAGMGGSLDATNVFDKPVLSVITSIGMDHMEYLGNTLAEIAEQKAGIIKEGCPMVSALQEPEAETALKKACEKCGIPYITADPGGAVLSAEADDLAVSEHPRQRFIYDGTLYEISLPGMHQIQNAVLALKALEILHERGFPTTPEERKEGLSETVWEGRLSVIMRQPCFIVDGAHNPHGARMLAESLKRYFPWITDDPGRKETDHPHLIFITGIFKDKDYDGILSLTCPLADEIIAVETPGNRRALPAEKLAEKAKKYMRTGTVRSEGSIYAAVSHALGEASPEDVIVSFGSLSFIKDIGEAVQNMSAEK